MAATPAAHEAHLPNEGDSGLEMAGAVGGATRQVSVALARMLHARGGPLDEVELWAVCAKISEAMAAAEAPPLITTDSVHLTASGHVELVPPGAAAAADTFEQYLPPELGAAVSERWWEVGEGHLVEEAVQVFALAATLYAAADHGLAEDEEPSLNEEMELLLSTMADDDPEERADLESIRELAAAGLMLCLESEGGEQEAGPIVARLTAEAVAPPKSEHPPSPHRNNGGTPHQPSEDWDGGYGAAPSSSSPPPPQWHSLLAEVVAPPRLRDASLRVLASPSDRNVDSVGLPATYVTPHDALMQQIASQAWALKPPPPVAAGRARGVAAGGRFGLDLQIGATTAVGSDGGGGGESGAAAGGEGSEETPHPSKPGRRRKLLKPCTSVSDLLADWNPERQVQLGFLAEAAKPAAEREREAAAAAAAIAAAAEEERIGADGGAGNPHAASNRIGAGGGGGGGAGPDSGGGAAAGPGGAPTVKRRLSAVHLAGLINGPDDGHPSPTTTPKSKLGGNRPGPIGFGSDSKPSGPGGGKGANPAVSGGGRGGGGGGAGQGAAGRRGSTQAPSRPSLSTLDKARSLFRRPSGEGNVWTAQRAAIRRSSASSLSPPQSPDSPTGGKISLMDWRHIRMSLVKAELEDLRDQNPAQVKWVTEHKACAGCGVRFGRFKWGRKCTVCDLSNCSTCSFKFEPPKHMRGELAKLECDSPKGHAICADCKTEISPNKP